jgi:C-terminal processing protease CtpA/Prc
MVRVGGVMAHGIRFGPDPAAPGGHIVVAVARGTPGAMAGVRAGDRISHINGTPTEQMGPEEIERVLAAPVAVVALSLVRCPPAQRQPGAVLTVSSTS